MVTNPAKIGWYNIIYEVAAKPGGFAQRDSGTALWNGEIWICDRLPDGAVLVDRAEEPYREYTEAKPASHPPPPVHDIQIPDGLPPLDGKLSRKQRAEIALDVIATLNAPACQFDVGGGGYLEIAGDLPEHGQLHSSMIKECSACARGMLFIKSVDRFNSFDLAYRGVDEDEVYERTSEDFGAAQADLIEDAFEGWNTCSNSRSAAAGKFYDLHGPEQMGSRTPLMIAIARNMVANHGEFVP